MVYPSTWKYRRTLQENTPTKARPYLSYTVLVCFYAAVHNNEERRASWRPSINPTKQIPKSRSTGTCMCTFLRLFTSQFLPPSQKVPVPTIGLNFFVVSDSMAIRRKPWPPWLHQWSDCIRSVLWKSPMRQEIGFDHHRLLLRVLP